MKEDHDGAEPSGNSVSVINLVRLASLVEGSLSSSYRQKAEHLLVNSLLLSGRSRTLKSWEMSLEGKLFVQAVFEMRLKDMAMAVPLMCCAADMLSFPLRKQVVLVGRENSTEYENMLAAAHARYEPNKTVHTSSGHSLLNVKGSF